MKTNLMTVCVMCVVVKWLAPDIETQSFPWPNVEHVGKHLVFIVLAGFTASHIWRSFIREPQRNSMQMDQGW